MRAYWLLQKLKSSFFFHFSKYVVVFHVEFFIRHTFAKYWQYFSMFYALCFMSRIFVSLYTLYNYTTTFKCPMTVKNINENNKNFFTYVWSEKNRLSTYICIFSKQTLVTIVFCFLAKTSLQSHSAGLKMGNNVYTCGFMNHDCLQG